MRQDVYEPLARARGLDSFVEVLIVLTLIGVGNRCLIDRVIGTFRQCGFPRGANRRLHFVVRRQARVSFADGTAEVMNEREPAPAPGGVASPGRVGMDLPLTVSNDPGWLLVEEAGTLRRESEIESIFSIANGFVGTRASLEEGSTLSRPATFAAGVYVDGSALRSGPALAVLPDWPRLTIIVDGETLSMACGQVLEHCRMLDHDYKIYNDYIWIIITLQELFLIVEAISNLWYKFQ